MFGQVRVLEPCFSSRFSSHKWRCNPTNFESDEARKVLYRHQTSMAVAVSKLVSPTWMYA